MNDIIKINEETIHAGPRFAVKRADFLRPDGTAVKREWIEPGDAVAVLPYSFKDNYFIMARQPREITGRSVLSLCAGKIDPGEAPGFAAEREMSEELGLRVTGLLEYVGVFYSSEGITDEKTYIFLAPDPIDITATLDYAYDAEEAVVAEKFKLKELDRVINQCDNAKAAIALRELAMLLSAERARTAITALAGTAVYA